MTASRNVRHGFTLVEMLVVIGIVTLLAAILFPIAKSVRDGARTSNCASNLGQISKAIGMYINDHNERYPPVGFDNGCTWVDSIYPYAKSTEVFKCPAIDTGEYRPGCGLPEQVVGSDPARSVGYNGSYDMVFPFLSVNTVHNETGHTSTYEVGEKSLSSIRYRFPSRTILLLDAKDDTYVFHYLYAAVNPGVDPISSVNDLKDGGVLPVHRDGVNLLYVDGHVKWQPLEALTSTPMWRPDGREPSPTPTPVP